MTVRYLEELRTRGRDANPFFGLMGIDVRAYGDGCAELSMQVRTDMLNGDGWLQGGVFAALCDEAMALALCTVLDERESIATISESTSFLRGVREGTIVARGRVIRKGRRVAFTEGEVRMQGAGAPLLSQTAASFAVIRRN
ncbi:MAG TPA: PaaI family thioesterase [Methanoculleus sp.]|nr:PaaI family thioesterase [Methanoculleus sp.]